MRLSSDALSSICSAETAWQVVESHSGQLARRGKNRAAVEYVEPHTSAGSTWAPQQLTWASLLGTSNTALRLSAVRLMRLTSSTVASGRCFFRVEKTNPGRWISSELLKSSVVKSSWAVSRERACSQQENAESPTVAGLPYSAR